MLVLNLNTTSLGIVGTGAVGGALFVQGARELYKGTETSYNKAKAVGKMVLGGAVAFASGYALYKGIGATTNQPPKPPVDEETPISKEFEAFLKSESFKSNLKCDTGDKTLDAVLRAQSIKDGKNYCSIFTENVEIDDTASKAATALVYVGEGTIDQGTRSYKLKFTPSLVTDKTPISTTRYTPIEQTTFETGDCPKVKELSKWKIGCDEQSPADLKTFISSPSNYKCRNHFNHEIRRNDRQEMLFPVEGGYKLWSELGADTICTQNGFAPLGSSFVKPSLTKANEINPYFLEVVTRTDVSPFPHNHVRLHTTKGVESYGFYPETPANGVLELAGKLFPSKGQVMSPDPAEFDNLKAANLVSHLIPISDREYSNIKSVVEQYRTNPPNYQLTNMGGENCRSFAASVLHETSRKDTTTAGWGWPKGLSDQLDVFRLFIRTTDNNIINLAKQ